MSSHHPWRRASSIGIDWTKSADLGDVNFDAQKSAQFRICCLNACSYQRFEKCDSPTPSIAYMGFELNKRHRHFMLRLQASFIMLWYINKYFKCTSYFLIFYRCLLGSQRKTRCQDSVRRSHRPRNLKIILNFD